MDQQVVAFHQLDVFSHGGEVEHFGAVLGFTLRLRDGQLARGPQLARGLQLLLRRHLQRVLGRVVRFRRLRHQQQQPSHTSHAQEIDTSKKICVIQFNLKTK